MSYTLAIAAQKFVLDHVAGMPSLAMTERFASASADIVDAELAGAFAAGKSAPLDRAGDTAGAKKPSHFLATKGAAARFHVDQIAPQAMRLSRAVLADATIFCAVNAHAFAA